MKKYDRNLVAVVPYWLQLLTSMRMVATNASFSMYINQAIIGSTARQLLLSHYLSDRVLMLTFVAGERIPQNGWPMNNRTLSLS